MERIGSLIGSTRVALMPAHDHNKEALACQKQGNLDKAEECYKEAIRAAEKAHDPNSTKSKGSRNLAALYCDYGSLLEELRRPGEAGDAYKKAGEYGQNAYRLKPHKSEVQYLCKKIDFEYSRFLRDQGKVVQADEVLKESIQLHTPASKRSDIRQYFSPAPDWIPSKENADRGSSSYRANNLAFETHLSSLASCDKPFFTQPLRPSTSSYILPQPGELIRETRHLAWCLQQDNVPAKDKEAWLSDAKQVIKEFKRTKSEELVHVQEIVALASIDNPELHRKITNALLNGLKPERNRFLNLFLLRGLSVMAFHRTNLTQDVHSLGDCVTLLLALLPLLGRTHTHNNLEQAQTLLQTISLLLDQMVYLRAKELGRTLVQEPLNAALKRFDNKEKYPELVWLIDYIRQALKRLPNNETLSEELKRRGLSATIGGLYLTAFGLKIAVTHGLGSIGEVLRPDLLLSAFENFKKAFSGIEFLKRAPWYGELCFIDMLIDMGRLDLLEQLLDQNSAQCDEQYLCGLCDRLERLACIQTDSKARDGALKLLKGLKDGKIGWTQQESVQQYASQSLNRVALMWPDLNTKALDIAAMERGGYAPPAWHPFWSAPPSSPLLNSIHSKAQRHAKLEAGLSQIQSIDKGVQSLLSPIISLPDLRNALHQYYDKLSNLSIQRVSGQKMSLDECYINLAIVESQAQRAKDRAELKKQAAAFERLPSSEWLEATNPNKLIALDKLFEKQKLRDGSEGEPKRILIQGRAGIGKTTLCKKLVYEYHHNGLWQDRFESVLWVPLRQLKTHVPKRLEDLLCDQYFRGHELSQARALSKAFHAHQDKTLFILDGLDEVVGELDEGRPLREFLQNLLGQSHVVITSRPAGVDASLLGQLDLELETVGFSLDNVQAYIQKFALESNRAAIRQFIKRTPLIQGLVNIPIQLDALCYSWDKLPKDPEALTMTALYEAMVDKLWRKDSVRLERREDGELLGADIIQSLSKDELEELISKEITYLGYLAFKGLEVGKIEFSVKKLGQRRLEFNKSALAETKLPFRFTTDLKKTSFLHTAYAERPEAERYYHFLHLTFQEFFAAKFLVRHLQAYSHSEAAGMPAPAKVAHTDSGLILSQKELQAFIADHKYNPRYEIMWWLVAGLLRGAALERFFTSLEEAPRDLIGGRHQQVMMGCLNEARTHLNKTTVTTVDRELMKWLRFEMKLSADADGLSELGRQRAFPEHLLLTCLDNGEGMREKIIRTLGARPALSDAASLALVAVFRLESESVSVTDAAIRALAEQKTVSDAVSSALVAALKDKNENVRLAAARALGRHETLPDVINLTLAEKLWDKSWNVKSTAASVLAAQKAVPDAVSVALVAGLQDKDCEVRSAAAYALGGHKTLSDTVNSDLVAALKDESERVRTAAAEVLSRQKTLSDAANQDLVAALKNENEQVRTAAAKALGRQEMLPDVANRDLITALRHERESVRTAAAEVLSRQKTLSDVANRDLVAALRHERESVRTAAAQALGRQATLSDTISQFLVAALQDKRSESVRAAAAKALGRQATLSDTISPALVAAVLQDESEWVRAATAWTLGNHKTLSDTASPALVAALQDKRSASVRTAAAKALGNYKTTLSDTAGLALVAALQDENQWVSHAATYALAYHKTLPDATSLALVAALKDGSAEGKRAASYALGGQKTLSNAASLALATTLQDENWEVRTAAARALGGQETLPDAASPALFAALRHESELVRTAAAKALDRQKTLPNTICLTLVAALQDKSESVRDAVLKALNQQRIDAASLAMVAALRYERESVRDVAAYALGEQKTLSAVASLAVVAALKDESKSVRDAAAFVLKLQIDQLYPLLPSLALEQIQSLYVSVLFPRSCRHIAPLYIQDHSLHFYTAAGLAKPVHLTPEQIAVVTQAFKAVQEEAQITSLLEEEDSCEE